MNKSLKPSPLAHQSRRLPPGTDRMGDLLRAFLAAAILVVLAHDQRRVNHGMPRICDELFWIVSSRRMILGFLVALGALGFIKSRRMIGRSEMLFAGCVVLLQMLIAFNYWSYGGVTAETAKPLLSVALLMTGFWIVDRPSNDGRLRVALLTAYILGAVLLLFSALQLLRNSGALTADPTRVGATRLYMTTQNPNVAASVLALVAAAAAVRGRRSARLLSAAPHYCVFLGFALLLILTGSRSGMLVLGLAVMSVFGLRMLLGIVGVFGLGLLAVGVSPGDLPSTDRSMFVDTRSDGWLALWRQIVAEPVVGDLEAVRFRTASTQNSYLAAWAGHGFVAFLLCLALVVMLMVRALPASLLSRFRPRDAGAGVHVFRLTLGLLTLTTLVEDTLIGTASVSLFVIVSSYFAIEPAGVRVPVPSVSR